MGNKSTKHDEPDMAEEYDFSKGVRGNFADRIPEGSELKRLTPAQAKKWLATRKKHREATAEAAQWLVAYAEAAKSGDTRNELVALEEVITELLQSIQDLTRSKKDVDEPVREMRTISKQAQALLKQLKADVLEHARGLKSTS